MGHLVFFNNNTIPHTLTHKPLSKYRWSHTKNVKAISSKWWLIRPFVIFKQNMYVHYPFIMNYFKAKYMFLISIHLILVMMYFSVLKMFLRCNLILLILRSILLILMVQEDNSLRNTCSISIFYVEVHDMQAFCFVFILMTFYRHFCLLALETFDGGKLSLLATR
jgi:hypothetical protein